MQIQKRGTAAHGKLQTTGWLPTGITCSLLVVFWAGSVAAQVGDVLTYHNDDARTGQYLTETTLTPANVNSSQFGKLWVLVADGRVDAQPLFAGGVNIPGIGARNVLYVVTEHDSVYAFDAGSSATLWHVSMLGGGETTSDDRGCSQITPEIGITSTPVIDRQLGPNGTIFVVAMSKNGSTYIQRIHALDLATGADRVSPVTVSASYPGSGDNSSGGYVYFDPAQYKERCALLLVNGVVYTTWASHCDNRPYTGWIIGYNEQTLAQTSVLNITPNGNDGAIWMSGGGPAADSAGYIYFLAANGTLDSTFTPGGFPASNDFGNAFLKISTSGNALSVADYFATYDTPSQNSQDIDLGSGGAMLLPDMSDAQGVTRQLAVGAGKDQNIYLVDRSNLGKYNPNNDNAIYQELVGALPGGIWATPAYFNGALYYGSVGSTLKAFSFSAARLGNVSSQTSGTFAYPGTSPSISANGTANGIVWAAENTSPAALHAYSAANLTTELYNTRQAANGRDSFGTGNKFITPTIANGRVYVGTTTGVGVFGLLNAPTAPAITSQPASQSVTAGATVAFSVSASGTAPLTYQWRFNGANLSNSGQFAGVNTTTLSLSNAQTANAGGYSVVVANGSGSVTSVVATLSVSAPGNCLAPPAGMAGWWPGDGNANDIAGSDNGTLQGGATASAPGEVGPAFGFDGNTSYVQIPDSPALRPANLTIETWVKFNSLDSTGSGGSPAGDQYIVFKQNSRNDNFEGYNLLKTRTGSGDVFAFLISSASGQAIQLESSTLISAGIWYHVAGVRGSNFMQLYVNGQLQSQATISFPQDYGAEPLYFGTSGQSYWDHKLSGWLDEVSLYSRALSSSEIAAIYSAGTAGKCKAGSPPSITAQPQSQTVPAGSNALFTVTAAGSGTLGYQWRFNGANLSNGGQFSGATTSALAINNAQGTNAGGYSVVVANSSGSVTSAVATLSVSSQAGCDAPPSGIVGWWPGDGNANDIAGSDNGTLQGGATATASGEVGTAFSFDGVNSYVQIPDAPDLRPTNLTIEAWVRFNSLDSTGSGGSPAGDQYIVFKQNSRNGNFEGYNLLKTRTGGGDVFAFLISSASGQSVQIESTTLVSTGVWYHIAGVRGSNFMQLFVNGQLQGQAAISFAQDYGSYPLYFGTSGQSYWDHKLSGLLDEVSLYNRALSASEVAAIYAAGAAGKCKAGSPPSITAQPQSQTVPAGSNALFTVTASGSGTLGYQWRFNGANFANGGQFNGVMTSALAINNAQGTNAGGYSVVVANGSGSVTSAVATLSVSSQAGCDAPPSGIAGWWPGDGNANDIAGSDNGTLQGGATASAPGEVGSAFSFDGVNSYVQIPDAPDLRPTNLTIEAWVRFNSLDSTGSGGSPAGDQYIVFKQNSRSGNFEGYNLLKTRTGGGDVFAFLISSASGQAVQIESTTLVSTGVWYHIAGVRGTNFMQLFVNGQLQSQAAISFPQDYGSYPLYFGTSGQSYWDHKLSGVLDEVSLYNRALSASEVAAIYSAGAAGKCKPAGQAVSLAVSDAQIISANNGTAILIFSGSPNTVYAVQRSTNLPGAWVTIGTTNAPPNGQFQWTDDFHDLGAQPPSAFYRYRVLQQP